MSSCSEENTCTKSSVHSCFNIYGYKYIKKYKYDKKIQLDHILNEILMHIYLINTSISEFRTLLCKDNIYVYKKGRKFHIYNKNNIREVQTCKQSNSLNFGFWNKYFSYILGTLCQNFQPFKGPIKVTNDWME